MGGGSAKADAVAPEDVNGHKFLGQIVEGFDPKGLRAAVDEMKKRLAHLEEHGPSQYAFTFKTVQPPDESFLAALDWSIFAPCPAMS